MKDLFFPFYHVGSGTEARGKQLHLRPLPFPHKPRAEDGTQGFLNMLGRGSTNTYIQGLCSLQTESTL